MENSSYASALDLARKKKGFKKHWGDVCWWAWVGCAMLGIISFWSPGALFQGNSSDATVVTDLCGGFCAWFGIFCIFGF